MKKLSFILALLLCTSAIAKECWEKQLSLHKMGYISDQASYSYFLNTKTSQGSQQTRARIQLRIDESGILPYLDFAPGEPSLSNPYILFAIEIKVDGELIYWRDNTRNCQNPGGVSFLPGQILLLEKIPYPNNPLHRNFELNVWGHIF